MRTLLIVHVSSLDSYSWHQGDHSGLALAASLSAACEQADHVVVTDQCWPLRPSSHARRLLYGHLDWHRSVTRFSHDEDTDGWDEPMSRLAAVLREMGISELVVGGVWATHDGQSGCVNATADALSQQGFTCHIDPALCGYEQEDEEESEPSGWLADWARAGDDMDCPNCDQAKLKTLDGTTYCYGCGWTEHNPLAV